MSDTESFDSVMAEMGEKVASPYWKDMYARLQRAHEREIVEALCDQCDQCDRIDRKAYEHEIEHVRKAEYAEDKLIKILEDKDGNDNNDHAHAHGCDYGHHRCDQHQVSYDELSDERHKAVCALRNTSFETGSAIKKLAHALGVKWNPDNAPKSMGLLRDRLIHLLGGDEPDLQKSPIFEDSDTDDAGEITITDELREWIKSLYTPNSDELKLEGLRIADRIDEQFDRICEQQEKVLQSAIDELTDELDSARAKNRRLTWHIDQMQGGSKKWREQCEQLKAERDELRRLLRQIAERAGVPHDEDLSEYSDEQIANAVIGQIGETIQYVKSLEWVRDRRLPGIEAERDELQAKLEEMRKTHIELPKDADGDYWHIGDESESGRVICILYGIARTLIEVCTGNGAKWMHGTSIKHKPPTTVEQVIRDLTLGKITESQAIERIEGIHG